MNNFDGVTHIATLCAKVHKGPLQDRTTVDMDANKHACDTHSIMPHCLHCDSITVWRAAATRTGTLGIEHNVQVAHKRCLSGEHGVCVRRSGTALVNVPFLLSGQHRAIHGIDTSPGLSRLPITFGTPCSGLLCTIMLPGVCLVLAVGV